MASNPKATNSLCRWIEDPVSLGTLGIHGGTVPDEVTGAILTPIYESTAFVQPSVEAYLSKGYSYSRQGNPTVRALEKRLTALESGFDAVCVSSGMAAVTTLFSAFLQPGDHCIMPECSYGGTNRAARVHFSKYKIEFDYIGMEDLAVVESYVKPNTRMIFTETASNPTLRLIDIEGVSKICKKHNILHACDSTFSTPFALQPIKFGADITLHSLTKYFEGHNMHTGGALIVKTLDHYNLLSLHRNILGNIMTAHIAFSILQTTKSLEVRFKQQSASAMKIAEFLLHHPKVAYVIYPGLKEHPQHALAQKQYANGLFGGMVSFEVKGGREASTRLMNTAKKPWSLCENLGSIESILTCAAVFTHSNMLEEGRLKVGITDGLIRASVGLEDVDDLIAALKEAL